MTSMIMYQRTIRRAIADPFLPHGLTTRDGNQKTPQSVPQSSPGRGGDLGRTARRIRDRHICTPPLARFQIAAGFSAAIGQTNFT